MVAWLRLPALMYTLAAAVLPPPHTHTHAHLSKLPVHTFGAPSAPLAPLPHLWHPVHTLGAPGAPQLHTHQRGVVYGGTHAGPGRPPRRECADRHRKWRHHARECGRGAPAGWGESGAAIQFGVWPSRTA
eukprot:365371-Chlamydomonas_euryale.AAC.4